jgi:hypothetical protein
MDSAMSKLFPPEIWCRVFAYFIWHPRLKAPPIAAGELLPPEIWCRIFLYLGWRERHKALVLMKNTGLNWISWHDVPSRELYRQLEKLIMENTPTSRLEIWCDRYNLKLRTKLGWIDWTKKMSKELHAQVVAEEHEKIHAIYYFARGYRGESYTPSYQINTLLFITASHNKLDQMIWVIDYFDGSCTKNGLCEAFKVAMSVGYYELVRTFAVCKKELFDISFDVREGFEVVSYQGCLEFAKWMANRYEDKMKTFAHNRYTESWMWHALQCNHLPFAKFMRTFTIGDEHPITVHCFYTIACTGNILAAEWFAETHSWLNSAWLREQNYDVIACAYRDCQDDMVSWIIEKFQLSKKDPILQIIFK